MFFVLRVLVPYQNGMNDKRFKHLAFNYGENELEEDVHDYFKLKFEGRELTDYEFLLWVKLFYYMKHVEERSAQIPSPELLESLRNEYNLPVPSHNPDSQELFQKIISHEWIKLQDSTGKYLFGPFSKSFSQVPSFSINRFQRSLNRTIEFLRIQICNGVITDELREKTRWMIDCIFGENFYVSSFFTSVYSSQEKSEPDESLLKLNYPFSEYEKVCGEIYEIIMSICDIPQTDWVKEYYDEEMRMPVLMPKYIELKGIGGFSCLSGFLLDAMFFSFDYAAPLMNILFFIHLRFHNSLLWRIEFAASPVNLAVPVEQRGQKDHTTQLKVFLFDSKDRPRVIRVDMPHKGNANEHYLHFNVKPVFQGENYDHQVITHCSEHIETVFDGLREAMNRECLNLYSCRDSDSNDDDNVLAEMQRFLSYEDMATSYIAKENEIATLNQYNTLAQTNFSTLKEALEDAYLLFYSKF